MAFDATLPEPVEAARQLTPVPSPSAIRKRRQRQREKEGRRVLRGGLAVNRDTLKALVDRGWIDPDVAADDEALLDDVSDLLDEFADFLEIFAWLSRAGFRDVTASRSLFGGDIG